MDSTPPDVEQQTEIETIEPNTETKEEQSVTIRPEEIIIQKGDRLTVTDRYQKNGREIELYKNTSGQPFETCLHRYINQTSSLNSDSERIWQNHYRLHVSVSDETELEELEAVYNRNFTPPGEPFEPQLISRDGLLKGEETPEGIQFNLSVSDTT